MPRKIANSFLIGCDPELFAIAANGHHVAVPEVGGTRGEIGTDHGGRILELRPEPSRLAQSQVFRLRRLLAKLAVHPSVVNLRLRAGAINAHDTIGGHVHFDLPIRYDAEHRLLLSKKTQATVTALDRIHDYLVALDILPKTEAALRLAAGAGYGRKGDVRDCEGHLEYRTFPSWLHHPHAAMLVLTLSKLAGVDPTIADNFNAETASLQGIRDALEGAAAEDHDAAYAHEKIQLERLTGMDLNICLRKQWRTDAVVAPAK